MYYVGVISRALKPTEQKKTAEKSLLVPAQMQILK
jgi:hypothetical protein